jgi:indolepyruvate ferredoxin oxidoreductase, beta subunit
MKKDLKQFNVVFAGVGGQGLITLGKILARAAFLENFDVKMSELHGLSQRGGSVAVQVRFGKNIFSPLVPAQEADLILALERNEALRECFLANPERTVFLINNYSIFSHSFVDKRLESIEEIKKLLKPFSKSLYEMKATDIMENKLGSSVLAGIYLLSFALNHNLIPLEEKSLLKAIKDIVSKNKIDKNIKAFKLTKL